MDFQNFIPNLISWFYSSGIKVIIILFFAWLISLVGKVLISRLIRTFLEKKERVGKNGKVRKKRGETLINIFNSTLKAAIWVMAIIMILPEFGLNIAPLLAGAGLVGLAVGMGARNLIQDYLAGIFVLLEDQYRIGEEIEIAGVKGEVIDLNLRRSVIKDSGGVIHSIPNGQIKKSSNLSR